MDSLRAPTAVLMKKYATQKKDDISTWNLILDFLKKVKSKT